MSDAHFRGYLEGKFKTGSAPAKALQQILTGLGGGEGADESAGIGGVAGDLGLPRSTSYAKEGVVEGVKML